MPALDPIVAVAIRNILFTTDFSPASLSALPFAVGLAERYGAKLFLGHVVVPDLYPIVPPEAVAIPNPASRQDAAHELDRLAASGRLHGVRHDVLLVEGDIHHAIEKMITREGIDLVVIATHGRRGVRKMLLGSIAEQVFRNAPCPVLTVGPRVHVSSHTRVDVHEVLLTTDFSNESLAGMPYACSVSKEFGARLTLLHVAEGFNAMGPADREMVELPIVRRLHEVIPADAELWCRPACLVEFGSPVENILGVAESRRSNLIVMGVKPVEMAAGRFLPGTAYKIASRAHCPVLTVRG